MRQDETPNRNDGDELDVIAAQWVARVDRGSLTAAEAGDLERWLAASTRHRGAYARAQAAFAYMDTDLAQAMKQAPAPFSWNAVSVVASPYREGISRRRLLWAGGVAAAAAASVAAFVFRADAPVVNYSAQRGEIRFVPLADGSLITLDTASTVAVRYTRGVRNVELVAGRALFNVAKDKSRPFVVMAGGLKVQAVGTSFAVRNVDAHPPEVLVQEGIVDVGRQTEKAPVRVGANMRVVASAASGPGLHVVSVDPAAVSRELAWREGMLSFEDVSLASAAEEFARYSDTRIIVADPQLQLVTITGVFSARNPQGFAHAAALSLGLKISGNGTEIELKRP
ncbi:MAG: FecR family protein [Rhodospirillaceae bacterium]